MGRGVTRLLELVWKQSLAIGNEARPREVGIDLLVALGRARRVLLDADAVPGGRLGGDVDGAAADASAPGTDRDDDRRPAAGTHDHVIRAPRDMDEVPRPQRPLLLLDDQDALARDDEEALLGVLAVVHADPLTGLKHVDVDAELLETALSFEVAVDPERADAAPARVSRVDDEPAVVVDDEPVLGHPRRGFLGHEDSLTNRGCS